MYGVTRRKFNRQFIDPSLVLRDPHAFLITNKFTSTDFESLSLFSKRRETRNSTLIHQILFQPGPQLHFYDFSTTHSALSGNWIPVHNRKLTAVQRSPRN